MRIGTISDHINGKTIALFVLQRTHRLHGCAAGRRACTVWPDGTVTPCSFLPDLRAGNVHQASFAELWQQGANWELLRDDCQQETQNGDL